MRPTLPRSLLALAALCGALSAWPAHSQQAPSGWVRLPDPAPGTSAFAPSQLQAGEHLAVSFYPRSALDDRTIDRWLADTAGRDAPPPGGTWTSALKVEPQTANIATASRAYRDGSGSAGFVLYTGMTADKRHGRTARWHSSSEDLARRHQAAAGKLLMQLTDIELAAAEAERRGLAVESAPPAVDGVKSGGTFVPGRYAGNLVTAEGKSLGRIEVLMFANGEYLFPAKYKLDEKKGRFAYEPATGKLNVHDILYNGRYYEGDFCVFGRDARGEPVIYAQKDHGAGAQRITLRRIADVGQLPPTEAEAAEKAAEAEARRYKYVTAPGRGLRPQEIEAVAYGWQQVYTIGGLQMQDETYLLLKDGTVHEGVPVPPQDMDVGLSRRKEPEKWGRWRKEGGTILVAWPDKPDEWRKTNASAVIPGRAGQTLQGSWSLASTYSIPGGASSWAKWSVVLKPDGRFEKFHSGGASAGGVGTGSEVFTSTTYNDDGAVATAGGPNFSAGSQRKNANQGDRSGRYEVEPYAITLRFDNGSVVRQPFFIGDDKQKMIWFEGSMMVKE
jgi:hypothetical protein